MARNSEIDGPQQYSETMRMVNQKLLNQYLKAVDYQPSEWLPINPKDEKDQSPLTFLPEVFSLKGKNMLVILSPQGPLVASSENPEDLLSFKNRLQEIWLTTRQMRVDTFDQPAEAPEKLNYKVTGFSGNIGIDISINSGTYRYAGAKVEISRMTTEQAKAFKDWQDKIADTSKILHQRGQKRLFDFLKSNGVAFKETSIEEVYQNNATTSSSMPTETLADRVEAYLNRMLMETIDQKASSFTQDTNLQLTGFSRLFDSDGNKIGVVIPKIDSTNGINYLVVTQQGILTSTHFFAIPSELHATQLRKWEGYIFTPGYKNSKIHVRSSWLLSEGTVDSISAWFAKVDETRDELIQISQEQKAEQNEWENFLGNNSTD